MQTLSYHELIKATMHCTSSIIAVSELEAKSCHLGRFLMSQHCGVCDIRQHQTHTCWIMSEMVRNRDRPLVWSYTWSTEYCH